MRKNAKKQIKGQMKHMKNIEIKQLKTKEISKITTENV